MGIRIKRSIGWGMPWNQFVDLSNSPDRNNTIEWLYDLFGQLTDSDLTVNDQVYMALYYSDAPVRPPAILQKRLLATKFEKYGQPLGPTGPAEDLFSIVWPGDEYKDIIFYPNLQTRSKWYRNDDDIDYAFENVRGHAGEPGECIDGYEARDFTVYKRYGHYPWSNYIMSHDGTPLQWEHYSLLNQRDDWVAGVPSEIRWYLTQHGVASNECVNKLRPIVAQWWS